MKHLLQHLVPALIKGTLSYCVYEMITWPYSVFKVTF